MNTLHTHTHSHLFKMFSLEDFWLMPWFWLRCFLCATGGGVSCHARTVPGGVLPMCHFWLLQRRVAETVVLNSLPSSHVCCAPCNHRYRLRPHLHYHFTQVAWSFRWERFIIYLFICLFCKRHASLYFFCAHALGGVSQTWNHVVGSVFRFVFNLDEGD